MDYVTLNNGLAMPLLGFGVFQIPDPAECERSVIDAITAGYRLIDTATLYMNEGAVALAKTTHRERMVENLDVFDFQLDSEDVARIATLETATSSFFSHRDPAIVKWMSERKLDI